MPDQPAFDPVPSRSTRHDGWTTDKQRDFLVQLARLGVVAAAARAVGMTPKSAYALRHRDDAASFVAAWDRAAKAGRREASALAIDRAVDGVAHPIFHRGRQVGETRRYNDRLLMAAIRAVGGSTPPADVPRCELDAALALLSSPSTPPDRDPPPPAP